MFLDLKSSTTIAEKIGHKKYSELIQECFKDISIIGKYGGEVYQYVGDEAVFTWDADKKNAHRKCIEAFYAFQARIEKKKDLYLTKFGVVPLFKAGIHGGTVMVAEVGILKKEIAFHGDTINTAARIQALCNEKDKIFLASDYFQVLADENNSILLEHMGDIILKGRKGTTKLYHPAMVA
jgi:adenylate cyclase